jgi:hypothetical protein
MGLACTSATFTPRLAAAIAALMPESPPPTTQKSTSLFKERILLHPPQIFQLKPIGMFVSSRRMYTILPEFRKAVLHIPVLARIVKR